MRWLVIMNRSITNKASPDARDDFLRSAVRIFLIVSPAAGKLQGRSRSLSNLDTVDPLDAMLMTPEQSSPASANTPNNNRSQRLGGDVEDAKQRRGKLSRSQVNSSEYVSVSFEGVGDIKTEEFLPTTRGSSVAEALRQACKRRGLDVCSLDVYVDTCPTTLQVRQLDAFSLGGRHLTVKPRADLTRTSSMRASSKKSGSYRLKGAHRFFSASAEEPADDESSPSNKGLKKWGGLFSNSGKEAKMDMLVEQLNSYARSGIPPVSHDLEGEEDTFTLEEDWRCLVASWTALSERQCQQQTAIWELLSTEATYMKTLGVITELFAACLKALQTCGLLQDLEDYKLFSNLPDVLTCHRHFWSSHLLPLLLTSRRDGTPLDPLLMKSGFMQFGDLFPDYMQYCAEQSQCQQYCREKHQDSELFKAYLAWCETRSECQRLRLMDILVRPMQRLTKYALLLKAVARHSEEGIQRTALQQMIQNVEKFVGSVNASVRMRQEQERLRLVVSRIDTYEGVDCRDEELEKIVKLHHSSLDLSCPVVGCNRPRQLVMEGDAKLRDHQASKVEVRVLLFTDQVLLCKRLKNDRIKVIRPPLPVDRLQVYEIAQGGAFGLVQLNEYGLAVAACSLHTTDVKGWTDALKKAQNQFLEYRGGATTGEEEDRMFLSARSPRGSSRASSLAPSLSGSLELTESPSGSASHGGRGLSLEGDCRVSSLSSDEGSTSFTQDLRPPSPRPERRQFLSKSTSPNTLAVQLPQGGGQSMPNLSSLTVPRPLGPSHRGVSYPPPSPRALRRSCALTPPPCRNPPLRKTRHIIGTSLNSETISVVSAPPTIDFDVPVIRGVSPPSDETSPRSHKSTEVIKNKIPSSRCIPPPPPRRPKGDNNHNRSIHQST